MTALYTVARAVFGYLFLVLITRIVGRRPGKQLTPFEFLLIFYLGGLTLTGMVGDEVSLTNAICQILTVAFCHYGLSALRFRSDLAARLLDGSPLILFQGHQWRADTMTRMRLQNDDVLDMARNQGISNLAGIDTAVLEAFGEITVIPRKSDESSKDSKDSEDSEDPDDSHNTDDYHSSHDSHDSDDSDDSDDSNKTSNS